MVHLGTVPSCVLHLSLSPRLSYLHSSPSIIFFFLYPSFSGCLFSPKPLFFLFLFSLSSSPSSLYIPLYLSLICYFLLFLSTLSLLVLLFSEPFCHMHYSFLLLSFLFFFSLSSNPYPSLPLLNLLLSIFSVSTSFLPSLFTQKHYLSISLLIIF